MSTGTGPAKYNARNASKPREFVRVREILLPCQSVIDIRICNDGLMYCEPCRTACEYKTAD